MSGVRIIPRLDIKGPNLVKGIHLEGLRVLGKPERFARAYYEEGADELLYIDVVASLYGRNSLLPIIERTAREVFIPLTVGGGIRTLEDIRAILRVGADKVALNTAAIARPAFIGEAARRFGSSTVVVAIEAKRRDDGTYEAYTENGRQRTGVDAIAWAEQAVALGAGELLVTAIDREGAGRGLDCNLIHRIATRVSVPVIACGGAGTSAHVVAVLQDGAADAVAVASMLHYDAAPRLGADDDYSLEGNTEHLRTGARVSFLTPTSIPALKAALAASGIAVRQEYTPQYA